MPSEKLTVEEICKILHISKRKCAWMLQNGMIPCKDTGKKTHRSVVLRSDLDEYIKDSAEHPEKYFIPVAFTAKNPGKREPDSTTCIRTKFPKTSASGSKSQKPIMPSTSPANGSLTSPATTPSKSSRKARSIESCWIDTLKCN